LFPVLRLSSSLLTHEQDIALTTLLKKNICHIWPYVGRCVEELESVMAMASVKVGPNVAHLYVHMMVLPKAHAIMNHTNDVGYTSQWQLCVPCVSTGCLCMCICNGEPSTDATRLCERWIQQAPQGLGRVITGPLQGNNWTLISLPSVIFLTQY
jgi:hypothetical protein